MEAPPSMSEYYRRKISDEYVCEKCGGALFKIGGAPIAKGSVTAYRCIRCSNRGKVKDRLRWDSPRLSGVIKDD